MLDEGHAYATCNSMNTGIERVQRRRDKLRDAGLRPIQIWVPDTRRVGFAEECARQSRLVRDSLNLDSAREDADWAAASDITGWTA